MSSGMRNVRARVFGLFGTPPSWHPGLSGVLLAGYDPIMTVPEVKLDGELARLAATVAESRGERLEDVVERLIRAYLSDDAETNDS